MNANPSQLGKTDKQENFPVASRLISARHRPVILAFYRFARAADDVADDPTLTAAEKITRLDAMEASLLGNNIEAAEPEAARLAIILRERGIASRHAQDLLTAFRLDALKRRYADWDELMAYCAISAMPVGRFVLDVHGESHATWAASDAICAALQIINHLQDCAADFRTLDRVYLPLDLLATNAARPEDLGAGVASPGLRACIDAITDNVFDLLNDGQGLTDQIVDRRLRLEIAVIHALAVRLTQRLKDRDPLGEETHLSGLEAAATASLAVVRQTTRGFGITPRSAVWGMRI
jgi:squalene synthase HpnC